MSSLQPTSSTSSPRAMLSNLLAESLSSASESSSQLDSGLLESSHDTNAKSPPSPQHFLIYTRPQLLSLSQSPMVKPPSDMPELKTWFGIETDNPINKKEEPSVPNSARERRFRRDVEDGDASVRPTFRSALQPSQMGNFKHQSLRDREAEKERDRDGHERLRHLSDKFDRDRLLPPSSRSKDAPTTTRGQTTLTSNGASRRADTRESAKKKSGEANEDWRRGGEPPRSAREDRLENSRRGREDRDNARSRHRDSSRSRRETSSSQRDKDREEDDDGRHWRDDGKREERMAARRERTRPQDRESDDRRWPGDEREGGRYTRNTGRERKSNVTDELKDKEKEPAWMGPYIPSESSGILGGQAPNGELDGIQAWKKGLKEKDKETLPTSVRPSKTDTEPTTLSEKPMDEIQIFRMLMKKEEDKKRQEETVTIANEPVMFLPNNDTGAIREQNSGPENLNVHPPSIQSKSSVTSLSSSVSVGASSHPPFNLKDSAVLTSAKVNPDSLHERMARGPSDLTSVAAPKTTSEPPGAFPPVGSRVLALKNKAAAVANTPSNLQSVNAGLQSVVPETLQIFSKNEPLRPHGAFSPFDDSSRPPASFDDARDLLPPNQGNGHQRPLVDQLFSSGGMNSQPETGYNNSLSRGSRLAKIFENKRDVTTTQRQESGNLNGLSSNHVHSVEELVAMLNNSSQRNNLNLQSNPHLNNNFGNGVPNLLPLQQQPVPQQQHPTNRLESLYESRTENRNSFVPDGMVPGLRTAPPGPIRRQSHSHFNDSLDESLPYSLQRLTQQPQGRGLEQLFNNPVSPFNQQIGRPGSGIPLQNLQQNQFRGGSSPALNATSNAPQRLPPGLANLGGRPPHDPSQYLGLQQNPPSVASQHGNNLLSQQQHLPFNGYNTVSLSNGPSRLHGQNVSASQPQFNLSQHGLDPRLSNHHHLKGVGGSGISGTRITSGFPPHPLNGHNPVNARPQQQQLLPHMLSHLMPPHIQHQAHPSATTQSHDLMAVLMGAPHRE